MLLPKRVKYRRVHRGRLTGKAMRGNTVTYGDYGLQALEPAWISSRQIEAARIAMTRYIKRGGQVWIKIKAELFNLRFQHAINQLENPMRMKEVKKDIARIKTVLRQLEMKNVQ